MTMTTNDFQILLKQERIRRGLSQEDLARKIGTTRITIHRWESGSTLPTTYFWARLSKLLGKPIEELFPETPEEVSRDLVAPITLPEKSSSTSASFLMDHDGQPLIQEQVLLYSYPTSASPHIREQSPLQQEMQRLELLEKRMELQQKQFLYARNKIETVLEMLEPQIDPDIRTMVLEATFSYLEGFPFDHNEVPILLPPFRWIKETLEAAKQKYAEAHYRRKAINITPAQLEKILEHLDDARFLGESDLIHMHRVSTRFKQGIFTLNEKGLVVRDMLYEAFERLRGNGYRSDTAPGWTLYNILYFRYFKHHLKNDQIVARLEFTSTRQFFRERGKAIEVLLNVLLEMEATDTRVVDSPSSDVLPDPWTG